MDRIPKDQWEECKECCNKGVAYEILLGFGAEADLYTPKPCPCTNNPNSVYNQQQIKEVDSED